MRRLLNAPDAHEVILLRGTTEAINLVASSFSSLYVRPGDEILISAMEHHSNLVPWQMACEARGAQLVVAPIDDRGEMLLDEFEARIGPRTRIVAIAHVSNALGTVNPVREIVEIAHAAGVPVLVDGAQGAPHMPVDVQALGCDFYAFSGHKLYGPSGIGALWGRRELLEAMPPWQGGGAMIESVSFEKTTYAGIPARFEAGTPNIAGAIGLAAAIDYVQAIGLERIAAHERHLLAYATEQLRLHPRTLDHRQRQRQGGRDLLRDGRRARTRRRHHPRSRGSRGARRSPLRAARDAALRRCRDGACVLRPLQHARRSRRAGERPARGARGIRLMSSELRDLYQTVILDHYKKPRNFGALEGATCQAEGRNPLCGDNIKVYARVNGDRVEAVGFEGSGCAISTASASLASEIVKGKSRAEIDAIFTRFHDLLTGQGGVDPSSVGKLEVLAGVREFPARVKCATLVWHALRAALEGRGEPVSTE